MFFLPFGTPFCQWVRCLKVTAIIPDRGFRVGGTNVTIVTSALDFWGSWGKKFLSALSSLLVTILLPLSKDDETWLVYQKLGGDLKSIDLPQLTIYFQRFFFEGVLAHVSFR